MLSYACRRAAASLLLLYLVLTATFFLVHVAPGEPGVLFENPHISAEQRQKMRSTLGLDRPVGEQYVRWFGAALRGEWGYSIQLRRPAFGVLWERLPATAVLVFAGVFVEHLLGLTLGIWAGRRPGGRVDRATRWFAMVAWATPGFVIGILMIEVFAVRLGLFPPQQMSSDGARNLPFWGRTLDLLHHLALPALTLGLIRAGVVIRFVRNGLLEVLGKDFVRTARAKGLSPRRILWVHALPNAVGPLIQRLGVSLPLLLSGSLVLEVVFSWPGLGTAVFSAVLQRDYPVILAATAFSATLVVLGSLAADLAHAWLDPRVRDRLG
ncbi:MAG: ABC transporter permease [Acidobacteriota bacterium]